MIDGGGDVEVLAYVNSNLIVIHNNNNNDEIPSKSSAVVPSSPPASPFSQKIFHEQTLAEAITKKSVISEPVPMKNLSKPIFSHNSNSGEFKKAKNYYLSADISADLLLLLVASILWIQSTS